KTGADALFISAPESVCWLLNIRARDTENTPLCLTCAIIDGQGNVQLYVDPARLDEKVVKHLGDGVRVCTPDSLGEKLRAFSQKTMLFDAHTTSVFITDLCSESGIKLLEGTDPCFLFKAIKNHVEIVGIRKAHIRDGAAVAKLLFWMEKQENVSELEVVDRLLLMRMQNELFLEPSFDTIAGSGVHGAIVHYRATQESNRVLQQGELFLLDSGGQYFDGTTDITRTVAIGTPSPEHKDRFTRVLKGHIALATAVFPEGTAGSQLDALARQFLWQDGVDYDHGTGHGVGCFLGVHEGPQRISKRGGDAPLKVGMVVSNEPGYYKDGEYGIRIENLVTVVEKSVGENNKQQGGRKFLGFETLTCVPIDTRLIDVGMLTDAEKKWLNDYHEWVHEQLLPQLDDSEKEWLAGVCALL
ncbi:MAG: aminopeptidase family protein P, partial [Rickettsiales bacterium]